jgi:hypothetical protein
VEWWYPSLLSGAGVEIGVGITITQTDFGYTSKVRVSLSNTFFVPVCQRIVSRLSTACHDFPLEKG